MSLAHWPVWDMLLLPTDPTPPLYYALHKLFLTADASAATVRSISLVSGMASVLLIYALGRLAYGDRAGLLAAALLAVWPQHVDYSQEARAYALLFLLTLASATSLLWWWRLADANKPGTAARRYFALLLFSLSTALSFYTHLTAVFWIALAIDILRTLAASCKPRLNREAWLSIGLMAILAIPGLIRFYRQFTTPTNFNWLQQASPAEFLSSSLQVLLPVSTPFGPMFKNTTIALMTASLIGGLLVWRAWRWRRAGSPRPKDKARAAIVAAFLALPLLVWLAGFLTLPIFMERTILYAVPGSILLFIALLQRVKRPRLAQGLSGAALCALLGATAVQGTMRPKEDWGGAYAFLEDQVRAGDTIFFCAWQYPSLRHSATRPLPAPLINWYTGTPILLEEPFGTRPDWDWTFYRFYLGPGSNRLRDLPLQLQRRTLKEGARIWLMESECSPEAKAEISASLPKSLQFQHAWTSPSRPASDIKVSLAKAEPGTELNFYSPADQQRGR
ncbi:MAG TPA: glycosyltransferase family 39 protein [Allosphingosinicella sp.]